jgi:hypothetical protein
MTEERLPTPSSSPVDRGEAVNLARNVLSDGPLLSQKGIEALAQAVLDMDAALKASPCVELTPPCDLWLVLFNDVPMCAYPRQVQAEVYASGASDKCKVRIVPILFKSGDERPSA